MRKETCDSRLEVISNREGHTIVRKVQGESRVGVGKDGTDDYLLTYKVVVDGR